MDHNDAMDRLEREIKAVRNGLLSDIRNRKDHPSFGVTKTKVEAKYNQLLGMIDAWLYVSGTWTFAGTVLHDRGTLGTVKAVLGIDVHELGLAVRSA